MNICMDQNAQKHVLLTQNIIKCINCAETCRQCRECTDVMENADVHKTNDNVIQFLAILFNWTKRKYMKSYPFLLSSLLGFDWCKFQIQFFGCRKENCLVDWGWNFRFRRRWNFKIIYDGDDTNSSLHHPEAHSNADTWIKEKAINWLSWNMKV